LAVVWLAGTGVNTFCNLIMTFVVGQTFLSMLCAMKFGVSHHAAAAAAGCCCGGSNGTARLVAALLVS
jgi:hypothetical protein